MLLQERRARIIELITKKRMVKVNDLVQQFGVSVETIRRDLEDLENHGYLKRVYGGAVSGGQYGQEPEYEHREIINLPQKQAIGKKAAEFINDGDTLFVDVGTTVIEVIRALQHKKDLIIITNATLIAQEMIKNESCRVILLGGELRKGELSVSGFLSEKSINYFNANKLLLGVGGITVQNGVTEYHIEESNIKRAMLDRADKVIAVSDYSKFGITAVSQICPVNCLDILVTDWTTPQSMLQEYKTLGVNVIAAPPVN